MGSGTDHASNEQPPPIEIDSAVTTSHESPHTPALSGPQWVAEKRLLADAINSGAISVEDDTGPLERTLFFFFYGSLMDPDVLKTIVGASGEPLLLDAWVEGYEMKMWQGIYPTLLPFQGQPEESEHTESTSSSWVPDISQQSSSQTHRVREKAWYASTVDQCLALQSYDTSAYEPSECKIHVINRLDNWEGEDVMTGLTFIWAGNPSDGQLKQGIFSLEHWIKEVKPRIWR